MNTSSWIERIEQEGAGLAGKLVRALQESPRTAAYRGVPPEKLTAFAGELYENVGHWLKDRWGFEVEQRYQSVGRDRRLDGVPLSQLLAGFLVTKRLLLELVRSAPVEQENPAAEAEVTQAVHEFFDEAIFFAARGYEDAQEAQGAREDPSKAEAASSIGEKQAAGNRPPKDLDAVPEPEKGEERDLPVSRSGDVGESPG